MSGDVYIYDTAIMNGGFTLHVKITDTDIDTQAIDLRAAAEDIDNSVDNKKFFRSYHMNKKHWITVCLDGGVPFCEIQKMLDASYELASKS